MTLSLQRMYVVEISSNMTWMKNIPHRVLYGSEADARDFVQRMRVTRNVAYLVTQKNFLRDGLDYYELSGPERDASLVEYSYDPQRPRL